MKYLSVIVVFLVLISCTRLLIGEKKLTNVTFHSYIKPSLSKEYRNQKFYIIPLEKIQECRGYPNVYYLGSENKYSFFLFHGKFKYKDEISLIALPDSVCTIKYPNIIDKEYKIYKEHRQATIVGNKMIVADN